MVNVLICEAGLGEGGSTAYLISFLKYLDREKFHPAVLLTNRADGPFTVRLNELGIEVDALPERYEQWPGTYSSVPFVKYVRILFKLLMYNLIPIVQTIALIKKRKIDLVVLNQEVVFHVPAVLASVLTRVPCVGRKGGVGTYKGRSLWRFLARFPEAYVASSNAEYRFHVDAGFPFKRMVVIYEGVDVDTFQPGQEGEAGLIQFGIEPGTPVIGSISRIVDGKGHDDLVDAASSVLKEFPQAVFLIVGSGDELFVRNLREQAKTLGIEDKVIFTGWRRDTAVILKAMDIFVHCPNRWLEGMGIATLEALASGKPVVITDNWGLSDTTEDGYNGFIVPTGDKERIAEKILILLKDREMRKRMGMNSRKRAQDLFDLKKNIKEIEEVMLDVLHSRRVCR